ncbi:MAG: FHA domain-containing protein [Myxococcales bacterium]|nr:FHA domain-containing protein [Myxococcales bacterium]
MKPCPNCQWMLKDTDMRCTMCGHALGGHALGGHALGGGAPIPPPRPMPAANPQSTGGGYMPPSPAGAYGAPPPSPAGAYGAPPPSPAGAYGAPPPSPAGAYGAPPAPAGYPPPPPPMQSSAPYGGGYAPSAGAQAAPPPAAYAPAGVPGSAPSAPAFARGGGSASPWANAAPAPLGSAQSAGIAPPNPYGPDAQYGAPQQGSGSYPIPLPAMAGSAMAGPAMAGSAMAAPAMAAPAMAGSYMAAPAMAAPPMAGSYMAAPAMAAPPMALPPMAGGFGKPGGYPQSPGPAQPPPMRAPGAAPRGISLAGGTVDDERSAQAVPLANGTSQILIGFLVTFQNDPAGKFWPLRSGKTTVGRSGAEPEADIAIADASASGRHAVIVGDASTGQAFIEDNGSRNGTFVNEQKLATRAQRQLADDDRVRLGSITLVVKLLAS